MTRIEELEKEIALTKELIELRRQLTPQPYIFIPYVQPIIIPEAQPLQPWQPSIGPTWIGDPLPWTTITTCAMDEGNIFRC